MIRPTCLVLALLAAAMVACGGGRKGRVVVLGIDGLDPVAIDLLVREGQLPTFARLRREGASGRLRSSRPMLSSILWTTIATGRPPTDHGIGHFVAIDERGEHLPVTSAMRRVRALWNIASEGGRTVGIVGWWATWPAEAVRGTIVSDHAGYLFCSRRPCAGPARVSESSIPPRRPSASSA